MLGGAARRASAKNATAPLRFVMASGPPAKLAAGDRRRRWLGLALGRRVENGRRVARPQLGDQALIRIAEHRDGGANGLGRARPWTERGRVGLRAREAELEHAEQLLRLALQLDPARVWREPEHEERVLDQLRE